MSIAITTVIVVAVIVVVAADDDAATARLMHGLFHLVFELFLE